MEAALQILALILFGTTLFYARRAHRLSARNRQLAADLQQAADVQEARRLAEETARSLAAERDALLTHSAAAVLVLNSARRILQANDAAASLFASAPGPLPGRELIQVSLSAELDSLAVASLQGNRALDRSIVLPGPGGPEVAVVAAPLASPDGLRCMMILHDVSELRRLENVRKDFVANVSHELRTPLASIRAMAETLQAGALQDPEVAGRFLDSIVSETDRLVRIARDLLVLSVAETRPPESAEVCFSHLVRDMAAHLLPQAEQAQLTLEARIAEGIVIQGSADQMEQVAMNLIENAIKYTPPGGRVTVELAQENGCALLRVSDTGIGILSTDLPRIFERFYRVDKGRSRETGGTGLGLSIVKHIVESHGGTVTAESELNRGSTFTVRLPLLSS